MRVKSRLGLAACVVALVLATIFVAGAKKLAPSYALENNVNPRVYMPLAVGNSWTYIWQNKIVAIPKEPVEESIPSTHYFGFAGNQVFVGGHFSYKLETVKETYKIYRQDKDHFFFSTACSGDNCDYHGFGDGRFAGSKENAWTWADTSGGGQLNIVLTETIKRESHKARAEGAPVMLDVDNRNIIHAVMKNNKWYLRGMIMAFGDSMDMDYDFVDHSITVPAGKFDHCILVKETYKLGRKPEDVVFTVFKYYAPDVGKVKEYQQLKDGTITYTLELESYKVAK